jgi:hypothetical protein
MTDSANSFGTPKVKNRFDEIFEVEIDGWCYGITHYPGEIHGALVHRVIKELSAAFKEAIEHNYVFNILDLSTRLSRAAKYLVPEKEIAFSILYVIPSPVEFSEDGQFVIAQLVDQVEQAYGGALEKVQKKWQWEAEKKARKAA